MSAALEVAYGASPAEKRQAADRILRALPAWFGIDSAREAYTARCADLPVLLARRDGKVVGFLALQETSPAACEVYVMGVLPDFHRCGIGSALMCRAVADCRAQGYRLLHVKTLDAASPDEGYARTRAFYLSQGFLPLQTLPDYWDTANPCLFLVRPL